MVLLNAQSRYRPFVHIVSLVVILGAVVFAIRSDGSRTATIADAVPTATVFPEPVEVQWQGRVLRSLAGGRGMEVGESSAPGGIFVAYDDNGIPASVSAELVLVRGRWLGISCEYGHCVPEVDIDNVTTIVPAP